MASRRETFERERPEITEQDTIEAATSRRVVESFNAHPISNPDGTIPALAIKWKFSNGTAETMLIGRYAAWLLRTMISHLEDNKWTQLAQRAKSSKSDAYRC
jgi:hypothetical protein